VIAKKVTRKRRRRGTGKDPLIAARFPPQVVSQIDRYAKENKISRSEARRALVLRSLVGLKS
jgi:hypothetical protein